MIELDVVEHGEGWHWEVRANSDGDLMLALVEDEAKRTPIYNDEYHEELWEYIDNVTTTARRVSTRLVEKRDRLAYVGTYRFTEGKLVKE